jgi:hypothetical protein
MSKWVRRGFGSREIVTSYADFFAILAGYDKRGVNPLGSTIFLYYINSLRKWSTEPAEREEAGRHSLGHAGSPRAPMERAG